MPHCSSGESARSSLKGLSTVHLEIFAEINNPDAILCNSCELTSDNTIPRLTASRRLLLKCCLLLSHHGERSTAAPVLQHDWPSK